MRYASTGPDWVPVEDELEAACEEEGSGFEGVEGREDENRLVKLLDLRSGTKVLGLLLGLDCSAAWADEDPMRPARSLELGLMPNERRSELSMVAVQRADW